MTTYRTIAINGLDIFYREAGSRNHPRILLLHGFPTSSHMFRNLIPTLADRFHVIAPDYPGFGNSWTDEGDRGCGTIPTV
jgi:pimeloyl-ACP methyl ester carboxylesterase